MLLILIKDLVKKGRSAVLKNLTSLVAQARPQAFSLFLRGRGRGGGGFNSARVSLQPRSKSSVLHAATGIREPRERGWLRSRSFRALACGR